MEPLDVTIRFSGQKVPQWLIKSALNAARVAQAEKNKSAAISDFKLFFEKIRNSNFGGDKLVIDHLNILIATEN